MPFGPDTRGKGFRADGFGGTMFILLVYAVMAATFVFGAVGCIALIADWCARIGVDILPNAGFLEYLVARFEDFKVEFIIPELIDLLGFLDVDYQPWMADFMVVYYFLSIGLTVLLLLPLDNLVGQGTALGATSALIRSIPGPLRLPLLGSLLVAGPSFLVVLIPASIAVWFLTLMAERLGQIGFVFGAGWILAALFAPAIVFIFPLILVLLLIGVTVLLPYILAIGLIVAVLYIIAQGIIAAGNSVEDRLDDAGLTPASLVGGLTLILPTATLFGAAVVLALILLDLIWVFGILRWVI